MNELEYNQFSFQAIFKSDTIKKLLLLFGDSLAKTSVRKGKNDA